AMAEPFEFRNKWWIRFKDERRRWVQRPTAARTKTEARKLQAEVEANVNRRLLGLEAAPTASTVRTLGELLEKWLASIQRQAAAGRTTAQARKHLVRHPLSETPLIALRTSDLENLLAEMSDAGSSSQTCKHVRGYLRRAFSTAETRGWWTGLNPAAKL